MDAAENRVKSDGKTAENAYIKQVEKEQLKALANKK